MRRSGSGPRKKAKPRFNSLNHPTHRTNAYPMKRFLLTLTLTLLTASWLCQLRAADPPPKPEPTLDQRVAAVEAYINNGDPTAPLKGKDGKIPDGLATPTSATSGPGHNAWMMASA